ncbi:hypothetical protein Tco_0431426 [Tanacetum coccineum]
MKEQAYNKDNVQEQDSRTQRQDNLKDLALGKIVSLINIKSNMVEFRRISLTGFRSCTSRSHYQSVSKQTTRYPCEASYGHKIEN